MAVALEDGLITPVLRDADLKPLEEISEEARSLAERARAKKLQPSEYTGATFSISNLGMMASRSSRPSSTRPRPRSWRSARCARCRWSSMAPRRRLADEGHALGGPPRGGRRIGSPVPPDAAALPGAPLLMA